ncbi:MAG: DUF4159 domain-containing protein [Rhodomicrobium sp.]|nr:DUF4159 domain-containing protein [Rhodomicrobium sp.]
MMGLLGALQFTSPWMLAGLAALPLIWWLLRLTPPRPETVPFPPASLLLGLKPRERTPVRSPWWLTLLRMLVVAAVIAALAGPIIKPRTGAAPAVSQPLLAVVDNGWAAGSRWAARQAFANELASMAEDSGQTLFLLPTAGPAAPLQPLTPAEFRQRFASLSPQPFPGGRAAAAQQIAKELGPEHGKMRVAWLSDGVEDAGADALRKALNALAPDGADIYTDAAGMGALAITKAQAEGGVIRARVYKSEPVARRGQVAAVTARGERLAVAPFEIGGQNVSADVSLDLPLELRNQVARLEIPGEESAGAVFLIDSRSQRRRVGLIGSEETERAQPLLSPDYYLERALKPFAEITRARTANLDQATADMAGRSPSIIILSDVGRLAGPPANRLRAFVEKGGMLLRFAGPRLEQGGDNLLPAPLRQGGRTLGGTMTWTSPQTPAPFEQGSPFEGMVVPKDVTISRQVLTDPAAMPRETQVWARLADGTPLVTATRRGAGLLVFFHVTANPDWSNLPLSGLFVEMMRKILDLSSLQLAQARGAATAAAIPAAASGEDTLLKPWRILDGFGRLAEPGERAQAVAALKIDATPVSASNPAGFYGPQNALRAINVMKDGDTLAPLGLPANARVRVFAEAKRIALAPWLFLAALGLFLADGAICALILGRGAISWRKAAAAAIGLSLFLSWPSPDARAEAPAQDNSANAAAFALQASLDTRLAYVLTGDAEADRISRAGLSGLSKVLSARTAVEPGEPMGVDPARDELVFFPLIYWPVLPNAEPMPDKVLAKIDAYMKQGGLIIFDTKNDGNFTGSVLARGATPLAQLLGRLDLPPLQRLPMDHVLPLGQWRSVGGSSVRHRRCQARREIGRRQLDHHNLERPRCRLGARQRRPPHVRCRSGRRGAKRAMLPRWRQYRDVCADRKLQERSSACPGYPAAAWALIAMHCNPS